MQRISMKLVLCLALLFVWTIPFVSNASPAYAAEMIDPSAGTGAAWKRIVSGFEQSYALDAEGRLWEWGKNIRTPQVNHFFEGKPIRDIQAGSIFVQVLLEDGTVWVKYYNLYAPNPNATFEQFPELQGIRSISMTAYFGYGLDNNGTVWAYIPTNFKKLPQQRPDLKDYVQFYDTYAIKKDGTVWWLGADAAGKSHVQVAGLSNVKKIVLGDDLQTNYALTDDGKVWAWGSPFLGKLRVHYLEGLKQFSAVQVEGLERIKDLAAGDEHYYVIKEDGTVWSWGVNDAYQLGDGTNTSTLNPVQVSGVSNAIEIISGYSMNHSFVVLADGTVMAWGGNKGNETGVGTSKTVVEMPTVVQFPMQLEKADSRFAVQYHGKSGNAYISADSDDQGNIVAAAEQALLISHDYGQNWTERPLPTNSRYIRIEYVQDRFYLWTYNSASRLFWSMDGELWTELALERQDGKPITVRTIQHVHDEYILLGELPAKDETYIWTSVDGETWNREGSIADEVSMIVWNGGQYTALGAGYLYIGQAATPNQLERVNLHDKAVSAEMIVFTSGDLSEWFRQSGDVKSELNYKFTFAGKPVRNYGVSYEGLQQDGAIVFRDYYGNTILTYDGVNFQLTESPDLYKQLMYRSPIFWNGEQYVLFASLERDEGVVLVSDDQMNWTKRKIDNIPLQMEVIQSGETFVGFSRSGLIAVSADGLYWDIRKHDYPNGYLGQVIEANGAYWAAGAEFVGSVPTVLTSQDGKTWTQALSTNRLDYNSGNLTSLAWNGERFVAVGSHSVWISEDGFEWRKTRGKAELFLKKVIWSGTHFVALGDVPSSYGEPQRASILISHDGEQWTTVLEWPDRLMNVAAHEGTVIVVGSNDNKAVVLRSDNLTDWDTYSFTLGTDNSQWAKYTGAPADNYTNSFLNVQWVNDSFVIMSDHIYSSRDGIDWYIVESDYSKLVQDNPRNTANGNIIWTGNEYRYSFKNTIGISADLQSWTFYNIESSGLHKLKSIIWTGSEWLGVGDDGLIVQISEHR